MKNMVERCICGIITVSYTHLDVYKRQTFDRPSWNRLVEGVKNGEITACICKDMSRIGRDHLQDVYKRQTPVSNPQPGDLVFFTGTYDTPGVSHVGIYVGEDGDGSPVMLHLSLIHI